jgi:hypothetical protein
MPIYVGVRINAETVHELTICRTSDVTDDNRGNYEVRVLASRTRFLEEGPKPDARADVLDFDRSRGALALIAEAIVALELTQQQQNIS